MCIDTHIHIHREREKDRERERYRYAHTVIHLYTHIIKPVHVYVDGYMYVYGECLYVSCGCVCHCCYVCVLFVMSVLCAVTVVVLVVKGQLLCM